MAKVVFKNYNQGQISLFPASLDEKIPADSPVRLVNQIVDKLDISNLLSGYKGGGTSAYHPRMMLKVVILCDNVSSFFSAKIINVNEFKTLPNILSC